MATIRRRRNRNGTTSYDATVRLVGFPTTCQAFPTKLEAELWASRIESAAHGRTLALSRDMTLGDLLDEVSPRLKGKSDAAIRYWRETLGRGAFRHYPALIGKHRDILIGAPTRAYGTSARSRAPRPPCAATSRNCRACTPSPPRSCASSITTPWHRSSRRPRRAVACASCRMTSARHCSPHVRHPIRRTCIAPCCCRSRPVYGKASCTAYWRDIDLGRRWAILPRTKNGESRGIPLTQDVVALLKPQRPTNNADLDWRVSRWT